MAEEEIFYPAVREPSKDNEDLVDEATVEHASAKDLIAQIMSMDSTDELYDAKVKVLSEQIEHHVGEEEGEMFPKARKAGSTWSRWARRSRPARTRSRFRSAWIKRQAARRPPAKRKRGHIAVAPFIFWLPDLDSNQGPAD